MSSFVVVRIAERCKRGFLIGADVGALWALSACGSPNSTAEAPAAPLAASLSEVERYLPLPDDTVYAYETSVENSGETGVLMMLVTRPRPDRIDLKIGSRVQRLEVVADGVRHITGGYVLKAPLAIDSQWRGEAGVVRITRVDAVAEVPAGKFVGCIEVVEEAISPASSKSITTVFCPDVGIVSLDVEAVSDADYAKERAVLKSFGPRIDVNSL